MSDINSVVLSGRITRDASNRVLSTGTAVSEFGFAINRRFKDREDTCFIDVKVWGKMAESIGQYLNKGKYIIIKGRLELETWETDGQKRSKIVVVAEDIAFTPGGHADNTPSVTVEATEPKVSQVKVNLDDDVPF